MAEFAPVVPISIALKMAENRIYGNYHLLLAHHVAENAEQYSDLFHITRPSTIIMDNSVVELGKPVDLDTMIVACDAVGGKHGFGAEELIVVLPDIQMDRLKTQAATLSALEDWPPILDNLPFPYSLMAIPQGSDIGEWVKCVETFSEYAAIEWIGIPRNFREKLTGSRIQACQLAHILKPEWNQHLFGFSDDLHDDMMTCSIAKSLGINLRGIDSAVPIRMALRDQQELRFGFQTHTPRGDWWDKPGDYKNGEKTLIGNMKRIRQWVS